MGDSRTTVASLGLLVGRVEHLMTRRIEAALGGPTLEQWRVLDLLADGEGHPMTEIATHAMVPPPTLTKIVDRLIEAALVYRRPDEADRRRILVFLSERGQEEHTALAPRIAAVEQEFVRDLDDADVAHLARLLEHLGR
jgi:MarR family transcriptional regulator, organic hydroperoxide resistance regulator